MSGQIRTRQRQRGKLHVQGSSQGGEGVFGGIIMYHVGVHECQMAREWVG